MVPLLASFLFPVVDSVWCSVAWSLWSLWSCQFWEVPEVLSEVRSLSSLSLPQYEVNECNSQLSVLFWMNNKNLPPFPSLCSELGRHPRPPEPSCWETVTRGTIQALNLDIGDWAWGVGGGSGHFDTILLQSYCQYKSNWRINNSKAAGKRVERGRGRGSD